MIPERYSIAFFGDPNPATIVEALQATGIRKYENSGILLIHVTVFARKSVCADVNLAIRTRERIGNWIGQY